MSRSLIAGLLFLGSFAQAAVQQHPGLESVEQTQAQEDDVHRLITGRVKRMSGDVQPEAAEFVRGKRRAPIGHAVDHRPWAGADLVVPSPQSDQGQGGRRSLEGAGNRRGGQYRPHDRSSPGLADEPARHAHRPDARDEAITSPWPQMTRATCSGCTSARTLVSTGP